MGAEDSRWKQLRVALASDHAGYELKQALVQYLQSEGLEVIDCGAYNSESTDYPDWAYKACKLVITGESDRAILICGTGIGMNLAANSLPGITAAHCNDEYSARCSRLHNNANVLTMGARVIGAGLAASVAQAWLATEYVPCERHARRLAKIGELAGRLAKETGSSEGE